MTPLLVKNALLFQEFQEVYLPYNLSCRVKHHLESKSPEKVLNRSSKPFRRYKSYACDYVFGTVWISTQIINQCYCDQLLA